MLIQARKELAIYEEKFLISTDWYLDTMEYFNDFPKEKLLECGLVKSKACFDAILRYKLPKK
jgi:hypothetical protein